jgi:hypothetical protein
MHIANNYTPSQNAIITLQQPDLGFPSNDAINIAQASGVVCPSIDDTH